MGTYTYAILEVSKPCFDEIADALKDSYAQQFHYDKARRTLVLDMHGIALAPKLGEEGNGEAQRD